MVNKKQVSKGILFLLGMIFLVLPMLNAQDWGNLSVGLQAYYKLDEKSGINIYDSSGNNNNATVNGTNEGLWTNETGVINTCANFSGTDNSWKIDIPSVEIETISVWIYYKGFNSGDGGVGYLWDGRLGINGYVFFGGLSEEWTDVYINNVSISLITTEWGDFWASSYNWYTWNHVILVRTIGTGYSAFGRRYTSFENSGGNMSLDEIGIWNRSLTPDEISNLYLKTPYGYIPSISPELLFIDLVFPTSNYTSNITLITFNCSATNTELLNLTLVIDGTPNITVFNLTSNQSKLSILQSYNFVDGIYTWGCVGYSQTISNSSYRSFTIDTKIYPTIILNSPINYYNTSNKTIIFNCSSYNDQSIINLTLFINGIENLTIYNSTAYQNLSLNTELNLTDGNYNWSCLAYDNKNLGTQSLTRYFYINTTYIPPIIPIIPIITYRNGLIYQLFSSVGFGIGIFIQTIAIPLGIFLLMLGIISGISFIIYSLAKIKNLVS